MIFLLLLCEKRKNIISPKKLHGGKTQMYIIQSQFHDSYSSQVIRVRSSTREIMGKHQVELELPPT